MVMLKIKDIYVYMYGCFYFLEWIIMVGIFIGRLCEELMLLVIVLEVVVILIFVFLGVLFCIVCCVFLFFGYVKRKENCFIKWNI